MRHTISSMRKKSARLWHWSFCFFYNIIFYTLYLVSWVSIGDVFVNWIVKSRFTSTFNIYHPDIHNTQSASVSFFFHFRARSPLYLDPICFLLLLLLLLRDLEIVKETWIDADHTVEQHEKRVLKQQSYLFQYIPFSLVLCMLFRFFFSGGDFIWYFIRLYKRQKELRNGIEWKLKTESEPRSEQQTRNSCRLCRFSSFLSYSEEQKTPLSAGDNMQEKWTTERDDVWSFNSKFSSQQMRCSFSLFLRKKERNLCEFLDRKSSQNSTFICVYISLSLSLSCWFLFSNFCSAQSTR